MSEDQFGFDSDAESTVTELTISEFNFTLQAFHQGHYTWKRTRDANITTNIQCSLINCLLYKIMVTELTVLHFNLTLQAFCSRSSLEKEQISYISKTIQFSVIIYILCKVLVTGLTIFLVESFNSDISTNNHFSIW